MMEPTLEQLAALRRIRDGQNPYGSPPRTVNNARQRMMGKLRGKYWTYSKGEFPYQLTELGRHVLEAQDARKLARIRRGRASP